MNKLVVKNITFNSEKGQDPVMLDLTPDQIVVFVGPNNAGKSQALKDIYEQLGGEDSHIVVKSIQASDLDKDTLENDIAPYSVYNGSGYAGMDFSIQSYRLDEFKAKGKKFKGLRDFYCRRIKTEDRLLLANSPAQIPVSGNFKHPLHYINNVPDNGNLLTKLSDSFQKVFSDILQLDNYSGNLLPLRLGDEVLISEDMKGERADQIALLLRKEYQKRPTLESQGDGMRSLAGILLYLHVPHYSCFFIDEPESFLHPPQALEMGKILCSNSKDKQLFIATHSEMLLKGLMEGAPERVKIIRITRNGNQNFEHIIGKEEIKAVWSHPLLRYSNIMDSIFYPVTLVCESNVDCMFYSMIVEAINKDTKVPTEVMFIECGGKHRLHIACKALKSLDVKFRVAPDFDIFRKDYESQPLYDACGGNWDLDCKEDWAVADASLPENANELNKAEVVKKLSEQLSFIKEGNLSKHDIDNLREALKGKNKWDKPKHNGLESFTDPEGRKAIERIIKKFQDKGIFVVPSGEMEDLVKEVGGHGKDWLENVIKKYPDKADPIFDKAKAYIASMNIYSPS